MIEVSSEPLASHLPLGEMASDITGPLWLFSLVTSAWDILVLRSSEFSRLAGKNIKFPGISES